MTGLKLPTNAGEGKVLVSKADGTGEWRALPTTPSMQPLQIKTTVRQFVSNGTGPGCVMYSTTYLRGAKVGDAVLVGASMVFPIDQILTGYVGGHDSVDVKLCKTSNIGAFVPPRTIPVNITVFPQGNQGQN